MSKSIYNADGLIGTVNEKVTQTENTQALNIHALEEKLLPSQNELLVLILCNYWSR